ncbi:accessory factor UbiK family protein [Sphingorhabdus arenilitoris]|uniref:Accessory factor UbiK family protein n=1 Tax=Sphingorhabdus arenilitoris TaxID=1490041 RepID=A0ABV8RCZ9_9SPHN
MQSENKIFDDIAKMLNGVAGTVAGMGREAQENMRERAKEWTGGLDLVTREEFEAVKQMAANARAEAEALAKRVEQLEAGMKPAKAAAKPAAKAATRKAAAKPAPRKPKA